ncbi:Small ribosomal subunit protein bS21 - like 1 [Theobroma cacao]|nr:Small ribosomal subunit protein bS21 - like 1 [Theobroma cacao]
MNAIARRVSATIFAPASQGVNSLGRDPSQIQQWRGIRVKVRNGNLERALVLMQRKMQSSGIERLIKQEQTHHVKNSEKRILARKNLERKIRSQELARKLQTILIKKVSDSYVVFIDFDHVQLKDLSFGVYEDSFGVVDGDFAEKFSFSYGIKDHANFIFYFLFLLNLISWRIAVALY